MCRIVSILGHKNDIVTCRIDSSRQLTKMDGANNNKDNNKSAKKPQEQYYRIDVRK